MSISRHQRPVWLAACASLTWLCAAGALRPVAAEKVLIYDEEKGITFVDKDEAPARQQKSAKQPGAEPGEKPAAKSVQSAQIPTSRNIDNGFIRGKRKEPSGVYFESGLQYFKAGNYDDALRQFIYADSTDPQPVYSLWIGKTYRQLGKGDQVMFVMKRILSTYPDSSVAADALFEMGFYYQTSDDYAKAAATYTQLTEQYPFAKSYSNGEEFREVAKRLKQMMRSEMISTLKVLGYEGDEPDDLFRKFQKYKGLAITGTGDQVTIRAIKQELGEYQKAEAQKAAAKLQAERYVRWSVALSALCVLFSAVMAFARISAVNKKKHLLALSQSLADISTTMRNV
jgi:tetratricopeptide (TPR) repeat protein